ncbi:hypothetical protein DRN74_06410, partial [Candidatus Micrarchaeota archaeon]
PGPRAVIGGWGAAVDLVRRRVKEGLLSFSLTSEALKTDRPPTSFLGVAKLLRQEGPKALKGSKVVRVFAEAPGEVELALSFGASEERRIILVGCRRPDLLPELSVSSDTVVIPPFTVEPNKLKRIAQAAKKGVCFAFGSFAEDQWHINLRFIASLAVVYGMPRESALKALTLNAAKACGLPQVPLEVGARPDIAFFGGDPLDLRSPLICLIGNGRVVYSTKGGR